MIDNEWIMWITTRLDELEMGRILPVDIRRELYTMKKEASKKAEDEIKKAQDANAFEEGLPA